MGIRNNSAIKIIRGTRESIEYSPLPMVPVVASPKSPEQLMALILPVVREQRNRYGSLGMAKAANAPLARLIGKEFGGISATEGYSWDGKDRFYLQNIYSALPQLFDGVAKGWLVEDVLRRGRRATGKILGYDLVLSLLPGGAHSLEISRGDRKFLLNVDPNSAAPVAIDTDFHRDRLLLFLGEFLSVQLLTEPEAFLERLDGLRRLTKTK
jgi:hypothetical protein